MGDIQPVEIDRAGRKGHQFADGSILWDNGEREYPTSGLTDEQKRNEARLAAGGAVEPSKPGVRPEEIRALEGIGAIIADPDKLLAMRKANAKAHAGKPPQERRPEIEAGSLNELNSNFRQEAKKLLEREIDRLEELKAMAIAGHIELAEAGVKAYGRNPPMQLHELVLETIRVGDSGNPDQLLAQLRKTARWTAYTGARDDGLPYPPPDGYPPGGPDSGVAPPMPPPDSQPGINLASQALGSARTGAAFEVGIGGDERRGHA